MTDSLRAPIEESRLTARFDGRWPVRVVAETGSTNADLLAAVDAPDRSVLVADLQTGGRGRLERSWQSPASAGLTFSVLLRPAVAAQRWGWLPLLTGLALQTAVGGDARLKWPNDLLLGPEDAKVAGILVQTGPGTVVIGVGLNVSTTAAELPVPTATSLILQGHLTPDRTALLAGFLGAFDELLGRWQDAGGDAEASGLAADYRSRCATIGQQVSVELPAGNVQGTASGVDELGRLVLQPDGGGAAVRVAAGDVTHVRPVSR